MLERLKRHSRKTGLPPGTLVHVGEAKTHKATITVIDYDKDECRELHPETVSQCTPLRQKPTVTWINIDGIHDVELIEQVGQGFGLHPLVLEDIVNTGQRPKFEDYEDYLFVVVKMLYVDAGGDGIVAEQVSLVLGENFLISFQEAPGDVFEPVRQRIRGDKGRIRKMGNDYLAYSLIDAILDGYFTVLERFGEEVEQLDEPLVSDPTPGLLRRVHRLRGDCAFLRKCAWPLREMVGALERSGSRLISKATSLYLRDLYDHAIRIIDTVEMFRDTVGGMLEIYLSSASNRMNEVMKVLTIIATIFIPLTFIVGVYGMNFTYLPEKDWRWGYPVCWGVMLALGGAMFYGFKRKRWI